MVDWLKRKFLQGVHRLISLPSEIFEGITAVWGVFTKFLHIMRIAFAGMLYGVQRFVSNVENVVAWIARKLRYVFVVLIPKTVRYVLTEGARLAAIAIDKARSLLYTMISSAYRFALDARNALAALINRVRDWLWERVGPLITWVARIGNRVADIVLHPDRLAAWLLPALWGPLWRYLQAQAVPIGQWLLRRSIAAALRSASLVETVLAKII